MSEIPSKREIMHAFGRTFGRYSVVMLLVIALVASLAAVTESDPEAGAEIAATVTVVTVYGADITVFDPFIIGAIAWSFAPVAVVVWGVFAGGADRLRSEPGVSES